MALKNNTWTLNNWYDQDVAGNVSYNGAKELWGWGDNEYGEMAQNSTTVGYYSSPIQVSNNTTWNFYPVGHSHVAGENLLTKTDGTLWVWGNNNAGQLGMNDIVKRSSPTQVGSDTDWSTAIASRSVSFALKTNGTLYAMGGRNNDGTSGIPSLSNNQNFSSPVQVPGTWGDKIYSNNEWSAAIKDDGTLWVWGTNNRGELGQNNTTKYSSPVQIPGTNWNRMACGAEESALATKTDGTLWFWGLNQFGGAAKNQTSTYAYSSPIQIGTGTDWSLDDRKIACGQYGGCNAIKTDGTLWSWGYARYGICGDNKDHSSPVQTPGTNWNTVSNSYSRYIMATKTDSTLWNWGADGPWMGGALFGSDSGPGNIRRSSPVQVPGTWGNVIATRRNVFVQNVL